MYGNIIGNSSVLEQHCHSLVASSWRKVVYFPEKTSGNKQSCLKTHSEVTLDTMIHSHRAVW